MADGGYSDLHWNGGADAVCLQWVKREKSIN